MNYSDILKVYWYTPQRNGTRSSIELMKSLDFQTIGHGFHFEREKKDFYFISNIRNPYSRLVSIFHLNSYHKKKFDRNFKVWIFETLSNKQFSDDYQINYHLNIQKVGRDFDKFIRLEDFKNDILTLPFINFESQNVEQSFNEQIIHNGYEREFENFFNGEIQRIKDAKSHKLTI